MQQNDQLTNFHIASTNTDDKGLNLAITCTHKNKQTRIEKLPFLILTRLMLGSHSWTGSFLYPCFWQRKSKFSLVSSKLLVFNRSSAFWLGCIYILMLIEWRQVSFFMEVLSGEWRSSRKAKSEWSLRMCSVPLSGLNDSSWVLGTSEAIHHSCCNQTKFFKCYDKSCWQVRKCMVEFFS